MSVRKTQASGRFRWPNGSGSQQQAPYEENRSFDSDFADVWDTLRVELAGEKKDKNPKEKDRQTLVLAVS